MIKSFLLRLRPHLLYLKDYAKKTIELGLQHRFVKIIIKKFKGPESGLEEIPNLSYVTALADSDLEFKNKFLKALSEEYASDLRAYLFCIEMGAPRAAAGKVRKLKDKFNVLGMAQAFDFAERHQQKLRKGNKSYDRKFKEILAKVDRFLTSDPQFYKLHT